MKLLVEWDLPIKTISEANISEHWTKRRKRQQMQKKWINFAFSVNENLFIPKRCHICLIRIAPRKLDIDENLPMSFKSIKDYIADKLRPNLAPGRADDDKFLTWSYDQEKGAPKTYGVKIIIYDPNQE